MDNSITGQPDAGMGGEQSAREFTAMSRLRLISDARHLPGIRRLVLAKSKASLSGTPDFALHMAEVSFEDTSLYEGKDARDHMRLRQDAILCLSAAPLHPLALTALMEHANSGDASIAKSALRALVEGNLVLKALEHFEAKRSNLMGILLSGEHASTVRVKHGAHTLDIEDAMRHNQMVIDKRNASKLMREAKRRHAILLKVAATLNSASMPRRRLNGRR